MSHSQGQQDAAKAKVDADADRERASQLSGNVDDPSVRAVNEAQLSEDEETATAGEHMPINRRPQDPPTPPEARKAEADEDAARAASRRDSRERSR